MNIDNFSYLWDENKADFVLVTTDFGYAIVNKKEQNMLLISDEELEKEVIEKMLQSGNKVYNDIIQAYSDT